MKKHSEFSVPDKTAQNQALGSLVGIPLKLKQALTAITPLFKPLPVPGPGDWLTEYQEFGQTYDHYTMQMKNYTTTERHTIYIQPLEKTISEEILKNLQIFLKKYYLGLKVEMLPLLELTEMKASISLNSETDRLHCKADDIFTYLEANLPTNCYCLMAICSTDIYYETEDNFVFGVASMLTRVGVLSLARYDDSFYKQEKTETLLTDPSLFLRRTCKVMVHEVGHMFGLKHCIHFHCVMNGSNHLQETDNAPLEMCVVCVRKLQYNIGFTMEERYKELSDICKVFGGQLQEESEWYLKAYNKVVESYGIHYASPRRTSSKFVFD